MRMSTHQAKVAASDHSAAQGAKNQPGGSPSDKDVFNTVMKWKQKKRPSLDEKEVALTVRNLNMLSWIGAKASTDLPITEEDILQV